MGQVWYLSNEMMMFWFTPFMLVPVHFAGRKMGFAFGTVVAFAYGVASTIMVLTLAIVKDWPFSYFIQG